MKRFFAALFLLALAFGCGDDRTANDQRSNPTAPTSAATVPTVSGMGAEYSPDAPDSITATAAFTVSPGLTGDTDTTFQFNGSSSTATGNIKKYRWSFGDDTYDQGVTTSHKYQYGGTYDVKLRIVSDLDERAKLIKTLKVDGPPPPPDGGGGGGGGTKCTTPAPNRGFIYGTVVGVDGFDAITQLPTGSTCANSYYYCGDMRRASPEQFRGIIHGMRDLGGSKFAIFNDCPFKWPPAIGERDFLYWKSCKQNYCP